MWIKGNCCAKNYWRDVFHHCVCVYLLDECFCVFVVLYKKYEKLINSLQFAHVSKHIFFAFLCAFPQRLQHQQHQLTQKMQFYFCYFIPFFQSTNTVYMQFNCTKYEITVRKSAIGFFVAKLHVVVPLLLVSVCYCLKNNIPSSVILKPRLPV